MRLAVLGAILITLPALVVVVYALLSGRMWLVIPALASLLVNSLPFVAAMYFARKSGTDVVGH